MSDLKSKLPSFKDVCQIAEKLYKDIRSSVNEIIIDYKKKQHHSKPEEPNHPNKPESDSETKDNK